MSAYPTTAIIGAGSSGIAAAKVLHEHGVPWDCFEASDRVGGNWVFGNANGMSSAYRSLHINTSRARMQFADFPMPASYPDFPHHTQIAAYFDAYVDHFGFREAIRFGTRVEHAARGEDGVWTLQAGGARHRYDALIVANGHHWDPRWPEPAFPGADTFAGEQIHAHDYKQEDQLRGRSVVVVGMGNSAMDIAVDASYHARRTVLAARRGAWVLPKYQAGKPVDRKRRVLTSPRVPWKLRQAVAQATLLATTGPMERYGLPRPDHRFGEAHPTISGRILDRLAHGAITPKPTIARLHAHEVEFADGSRVEADLVVYCTGYRITFPFFDQDVIAAPDNDIALYRRVFHPAIPDVFFVGLVQPLGAIMPLAEAQGQLIAAHLRGEHHLPSAAAMRAQMRRDRAAMARRYVPSKRHTIQVDFDDYLHELRRERRAGARRAAQAGFALPVVPKAAQGEALAA